MKTRNMNSRGFTLIELLVVIGILGVLMAMLLPGVGGVRRAAFRNQAQQEAKGIATAVQAFNSEYGRFPLQQTGDQDSGDYYGPRTELRASQGNALQVRQYIRLIRSLRGMDSGDNPRGTVYLTINERSIITNAHSGVPAGFPDEQYVDPWENRYAVVADWNGDGATDTGVDLQGAGTLQRNTVVVVWSWGMKGYEGRNTPAGFITSLDPR